MDTLKSEWEKIHSLIYVITLLIGHVKIKCGQIYYFPLLFKKNNFPLKGLKTVIVDCKRTVKMRDTEEGGLCFFKGKD